MGETVSGDFATDDDDDRNDARVAIDNAVDDENNGDEEDAGRDSVLAEATIPWLYMSL